MRRIQTQAQQYLDADVTPTRTAGAPEALFEEMLAGKRIHAGMMHQGYSDVPAGAAWAGWPGQLPGDQLADVVGNMAGHAKHHKGEISGQLGPEADIIEEAVPE